MPKRVPDTKGSLRPRVSGVQATKYKPSRFAYGGILRQALRLSRGLPRELVLPLPEREGGSSGGAGASGEWGTTPPRAPDGYTVHFDCNTGYQTASFSQAPNSCGAVSSNPTPPSSGTTTGALTEWGVIPNPDIFKWTVNREWRGEPLVAQPIPGYVLPMVHSYRSTDVAPKMKRPPPAERKPWAPPDPDGRPHFLSITIPAHQYEVPVFPVRPPGSTLGSISGPAEALRPLLRHLVPVTPRTRPTTLERASTQTQPKSERYTPPQPAVKVAFAPSPFFPKGFYPNAWHFERPDGAAKVRSVPVGMMRVLQTFHSLTEIGDVVESLYDALEEYGYVTGGDRGLMAKISAIARNWDEFWADPQLMGQAIENLIANDIEDRVLGRLLGSNWQTGVRTFKDQYSTAASIGAGL